MTPSMIFNIPVDSMHLAASMAQRSASIASLELYAPAADANLSGLLSFDAENDLQLNLHTRDLMSLNHLIHADTLHADAHLSAHMTGALDSLCIDSFMGADAICYNKNEIDSMDVEIKAQRIAGDLTVQSDIALQQINASGLSIDSLNFRIDVDSERIDIAAALAAGEALKVRLNGQYLLHGPRMILFPLIEVDVQDRHWRGGGDSTSIVLGAGEVRVNNFELQRPDSTGIRTALSANGVLRLHGKEDLHLIVRNLDINPINGLLASPVNIRGIGNMDIHLAGSAEAPLLSLSATAQNFLYNGIAMNQVLGKLDYRDEQITAQIVSVQESDSLVLHTRLPIRLSIADKSFEIDENAPFEISLTTDHLQLSDLLPQQYKGKEITGLLNIDVHATNTLSNINPEGQIVLQNGRLRIDELGFALDGINSKLRIKPDSVRLAEFHASRDQGAMDVNGFAVLDSSIFSGIINFVQLHINADELYLSTKPEHEMQIDSDINITGPPDSLRMNGQIEILRSSFYIPALIGNDSKKQRGSNLPLLVQATTDATDAAVSDTLPAARQKPQALKNLRGALKVKIRKNTWVKGDNMRVEFWGDLDIVKNSDVFELFGDIEVLRGQYDFLGRRFKLSEGEIYFQGGEKINPTLNVKADYVFRDSRKDKKTLRLIISDRALEPKLQFTIDDKPITEGEAISYILFSRAPNEVGSSTTSQAGYIATDLVYGMMSAELSNRLGSSLGLDYIEIKGQDNLNSATFIVGKYVTPDLFMSYEHSIGALEEDTPPQVVTVEYELSKFLFLQLISGETKSTGMDILIKLDSQNYPYKQE